jgi:uncharacterized membrane protein YdjX (TVP38/TMEM64 family)
MEATVSSTSTPDSMDTAPNRFANMKRLVLLAFLVWRLWDLRLLTNFLFGLTSLTLWTYAWVSFVFFFPLCYAFSYLGFYTGGFMLDGDMSRMVRIIVVSLGIGLLILGGRHLLKNSTEYDGTDTAQ